MTPWRLAQDLDGGRRGARTASRSARGERVPMAARVMIAGTVLGPRPPVWQEDGERPVKRLLLPEPVPA